MVIEDAPAPQTRTASFPRCPPGGLCDLRERLFHLLLSPTLSRCLRSTVGPPGCVRCSAAVVLLPSIGSVYLTASGAVLAMAAYFGGWLLAALLLPVAQALEVFAFMLFLGVMKR